MGTVAAPTGTDESPTAGLDSGESPAGKPRGSWRWWTVLSVVLLLSAIHGLFTVRERWDQANGYGQFAEFHSIVQGWWLRSWLTELAVLWWVVAMAGTIGSFLNVVVYRMPRGKSLGASGSRCVHCDAAIRWYDNLPVVGWYVLRARCRNCQQPISGRYPLVESLAIVLGLGLFLVTVQTTCLGLPWTDETSLSTPCVRWYFWLLEPIPVARVVLFFYLLPVQMACLAVAWASYDGVRLPLRFYVSVAVICVLGSSLYQSGVLGGGTRDNRVARGAVVDFLSPSWSCFIDRCSQTRAGQGVGQGAGHGAGQGAGPEFGQGGASTGESGGGTPSLSQALQRAEVSPREWLLASGRANKTGWPGLPRLWLGQVLAAVLGACLGGLCGFISGLFGGRAATRERLWSGDAPLVLALAGLVGGWYLPLAIASLWLIERGLRRIGVGVRTAIRGNATTAMRASAEWFLLPWYFWVAVAAWRWFP